MSWRIWRNRLPLRGVLRPSIPDNGDCLRCFRGMGEFPASRERETGCRFARFYVQAFRTTAIGRDAFAGWANFLRRADVKQAAASRGLRSSIPDNDDCLRCFHGWTDFPRRADVKRAAASRDLRSAIPDNGGFAGWTDFLFRAGVTFKHSGQRSVFCEASVLSGEPSAGGAGQVFLTYKSILGGYACRSCTLWRPPLAT